MIWSLTFVACRAGTFGMNCNETCSINCRYSKRCSSETGNCSGGCVKGWKGSHCSNGILHYILSIFYLCINLFFLLFTQNEGIYKCASVSIQYIEMNCDWYKSLANFIVNLFDLKKKKKKKNNKSFKCNPVLKFSYLRHKVLKEIKYLKILCLQREPVYERKGAWFKYF